MASPAKRDWQRVPQAFIFNGLHYQTLTLNANVGASVSASTVSGSWGILPLPFACKIAKVAISFTSISDLASATINICYGIGSGSLLSGTPVFTPIVGDDSYTAATGSTGTSGNLGYPSTACWAAQNQAVLWNTATGTTASLGFTLANFPGATTGSGGIAVFGQAPSAGNFGGIINSDVVYPTGQEQGGTLLSGYCGFLRAAFNTSGASNVSGCTIILGLEAITLTQNWVTPNSPQPTPIPGIAF
jgi:hypothetical protein